MIFFSIGKHTAGARTDDGRVVLGLAEAKLLANVLDLICDRTDLDVRLDRMNNP
jgi:hypothetical protein